MRFQSFARPPDGGNAFNGENAHFFDFNSILAVRIIGGQSAVHPDSRPYHMGWVKLEWTD